jgi:hypothetical protein
MSKKEFFFFTIIVVTETVIDLEKQNTMPKYTNRQSNIPDYHPTAPR